MYLQGAGRLKCVLRLELYEFFESEVKRKSNLSKQAKNEAKSFAVAAANLARGRHCTDIAVLDLKGLSPATDYFVIATGTSDRQMRTVADEIRESAGGYGFAVFGRAGYEQARWILLDFIDVVVHIFDEEYREYYELEYLWGDARRINWQRFSKK